MVRQRVNPFSQGSAERVLFDRFRKATLTAQSQEEAAARFMTDARANRASAEQYAKALRALGHGDKVPGQAQLPNYAALGDKTPEQTERVNYAAQFGEPGQ